MSVKYTKFDSFLKRILGDKEYREVKSCERCVIMSTKDKLAFRFSFLTNERIYVTENPPKCLLYSVHLQDVVDVCMVNEKVNFLQDELKDRVQHVLVKYISATSETTSVDKSEYEKHFRTIGRPSQQSLAMGYPGLIENQASSSTLQRSPPLLCSYAELGIRRSEPLPLSPALIQEKASSTPAFQGKNNAEKPQKEVRNRWVYKDPYPIHKLIPEIEDDSSSNVEELHIYVLDENTTFFLMLKSMWRNYIIHSTKQFSILEKKSAEKLPAIETTTRCLFSDLKQELLSIRNVEHLYGLYHELKIAVSRDNFIKFLFWNDDLLLKRSFDLITRYIRNSVSLNVVERADEIELAVLILQTIAVMLSEVESIPRCYKILQNFSLPSFKSLIDALLCPPQLACSSWLYHEDIKLHMMEYTAAVCEVLYQFIVSSQQILWIAYRKSSVFNASTLFTSIGQNEHLGSFLGRLIDVCLHTWDPRENKSAKFEKVSRVEPFTPEDAVKAFYLFTVFHRIIAKSSTAAHHARSSFQEEFKYYISPGSVSLKFPSTYPISGMARSAVYAVGSYITGSTSHSK